MELTPFQRKAVVGLVGSNEDGLFAEVAAVYGCHPDTLRHVHDLIIHCLCLGSVCVDIT